MENLLKEPKISFIVVSHNFEKYIEDCLESIKKQTYKNFEIIVVDDYSRDKTSLKINNFMMMNEGLDVKFICNRKNKGQLASFLEGLKSADGEFVCQIDGDDILFEDYAVTHIEAHLKASVALTSSQHIDIDGENVVHCCSSVDAPNLNVCNIKLSCEAEGLPVSKFLKERASSRYDVEILSNEKYSFASWHWAPTSSAMMRTSACKLLLNLKNPEKIKITADKFIFSFLHLIGSSAVIYKPLYAYRKHGANYSLANKVMGSVRYLKPETQKAYIRNNILIRSEMLKFVLQNYHHLSKILNGANINLIIKKIIFSFDLKTLKSLIKSLSI